MTKKLKRLGLLLVAFGLLMPQLASAKKKVETTDKKTTSKGIKAKKKSKKAKSDKKSKTVSGEKKAKLTKAQITKRVGQVTSRTQFNKRIKAAKITDLLKKGPKSKLKDCSGKKGRAVILYHYMGDSYLTGLAQDTVKLAPIFDSYDYKVLVKFPVTVGPKNAKFNLSGKAFKEANKVYKPTASNFVKAIQHAVDKGYTIDIFLLSHGWTTNGVAHFMVSDGTYEPPGVGLSMKTVEEGLSFDKTGCRKLPIRMVYHMACFGSKFASAWQRLGAKVSIGTRYINFYPTQMGKFVKLFNKGKTVKDAVKGSNTTGSRALVQTYLQLFDAPATKWQGDWPGCKFPHHVMGKNGCSKDYFKDRWGLSNSEIAWSQTKKGRAVTNRSSTWIITGDKKITKNSR